MRRFVVLLGALFLVVGIRLYNNGLMNCGFAGELYYGTFDTVKAETQPLLVEGPHRMDIVGDENTALEVIKNLSGKLLRKENIGEMTIFYAFSPRLIQPCSIKGQEVNLMIAVSNGNVAIGTPLLYGSY